MANERELQVLDEHENEDWIGFHTGAPDWLFIKQSNGEITDVKFVEVKSPTGRVRYSQDIWLKALRFLGADATVRRVE